MQKMFSIKKVEFLKSIKYIDIFSLKFGNKYAWTCNINLGLIIFHFQYVI